MSDTSDILAGIAAQLVAASIGTYRSNGTAYTSGETAIVFGRMPQAPDRCIALTDYVLGDNAGRPYAQHRVQFSFRGRPNIQADVWDLRAAVLAEFQSCGPRLYGSIAVSQSLRTSSIPNGFDENDRPVIDDNYSFDVVYPATANRPS